jgi:hypothetical protein
MIQDILNDFYDGKIELLEALIRAEKERHNLEMELTFLKDFKQENSNDIKIQSDEFKDGYSGHLFEVRNGRKTYNFRGINEWETYNKAKQDCEKRYKSMLEAKINGAVHANISEDGEELKLPVISYGKPSVIVKEIVNA